MAFGTMSSRLLGQLRESLLAYYFDKQITDAWAAAFRIPNMFRRLLGEGSLSVSFIPVFVNANQDNKERAQNLVNSVYSCLLIVLGLLTAMGTFYSEPLLGIVLDSSYVADTEKYLMTLRLCKIMFGFIFFISSYAFMMGILNALGQFALPAMAPTLWNIALIVSTILPQNIFAKSGDQLAIGVLVGGFLQAAILVPALIKSGFLPKISFNLKNKDLQTVFKNMLPGIVGTGLLQFTTIINLRFSSSLQEGTISYINYIDRLIELPLSLISVSLGTALLPILSGYKSKGDDHKFSNTAKHYLELNLLLTMAAAAGMYVLAHPIVGLLFGRGKFGVNDVFATAEILKTYCWIMIFSSGVRVLTPAYYAVKNTWFPALVSGFCLALHLVVAPILMKQYQVHGLMTSTIITACLNLLLLLIFFTKFVSKFPYLDFIKNIFVYLILASLVGASAHVYFLIQSYLPTGAIFQLINILLTILLAISFFVLIGYLFKITIIHEISNKVIQRLKDKIKAS